MKKTVLITGTSSGIGRAAAIEFSRQGWQVAATMRTPAKETELGNLPGVKLFALDVTSQESIAAAMQAAQAAFGRIDVVVNNAGFGVDGIFEFMDDETIRKQFDTNVFGLMRVTRAAIQIMRAQGGGSILQVSSMGGRLAFPLYSIYHSTKWAVEGFTESLQFEVAPFNITVKLIEPGAIVTEFNGTSRHEVKPVNDRGYDGIIQRRNTVVDQTYKKGVGPEGVAKTIVKAAADGRSQLRYPTGAPAPLYTRLRKFLPDRWWFWIIRRTYKL